IEPLDQEVSKSQESVENSPLVEQEELKEEISSENTEIVQAEVVAEVTKDESKEETILEDEDSDAEHEDEVTYKMDTDHDTEDDTDLSGLNAEQLVDLIEQAAKEDDLVHAVKTARSIKNRITSLFEDE